MPGRLDCEKHLDLELRTRTVKARLIRFATPELGWRQLSAPCSGSNCFGSLKQRSLPARSHNENDALKFDLPYCSRIRSLQSSKLNSSC